MNTDPHGDAVGAAVVAITLKVIETAALVAKTVGPILQKVVAFVKGVFTTSTPVTKTTFVHTTLGVETVKTTTFVTTVNSTNVAAFGSGMLASGIWASFGNDPVGKKSVGQLNRDVHGKNINELQQSVESGEYNIPEITPEYGTYDDYGYGLTSQNGNDNGIEGPKQSRPIGPIDVTELMLTLNHYKSKLQKQVQEILDWVVDAIESGDLDKYFKDDPAPKKKTSGDVRENVEKLPILKIRRIHVNPNYEPNGLYSVEHVYTLPGDSAKYKNDKEEKYKNWKQLEDTLD